MKRPATTAARSANVPDLIFARADALQDREQRPGPVQTWTDADESPFAECWHDGDERVLDLVGVARFRFRVSSGPVTVTRVASTRADVTDAFERWALPLVLCARDAEVLHASAVCTPHGVIAFAGPTPAGKSTLARAFGKHGHSLWADDALAFDAARTSDVTTMRLPTSLRLRADAAAHWRDEASVPTAQPDMTRARLCAVYLLERRETDAPICEITERAPALAWLALLERAHCFSLHDVDRRARMLEHYLSLVEAVPIRTLCFRAGLGCLDAIVEQVERDARTTCAPRLARNQTPLPQVIP